MAGKKYGDLNASTGGGNSDLYAVNQDKGGGVFETRKMTGAQLIAWIRGKLGTAARKDHGTAAGDVPLNDTVIRPLGAFDASTGSYPKSPIKGDWYRVSVKGTVSGRDLKVDDKIYYDGTAWQWVQGGLGIAAGDMLTDADADGRYIRNMAKVSELTYPLYISHRGGSNIYPEQTMAGFKASADSGFLPEMDIQPLSDGTLVLCHDVTVDRTMRGVAGNVSSLTLAEWRKAVVVNTHTKAADPQPAATWEEVLDKLGGEAILVPEIKSSASSRVQDIIDSILNRGLVNSVIVQSFTYSVCQKVASAGIPALYLFSSMPPETPATIAGDGIQFVGPKWDSVTSSEISSFQSKGIKVVGCTVNTQDDKDTFIGANGADGIFSDDPWYVSGRMAKTLRSDFRAGVGQKGAYIQALSSDSSAKNKLLDDSYFSNSDGGLVIDVDTNTFKNSVVYLPEYGKINLPVRITMRARRLNTNEVQYKSSEIGSVGLVLHRKASEHDIIDDANPNNDYGVTLKQGNVWAYEGNSVTRYTDNTKSTDISRVSSDYFTLIADITDTKVKIVVPELGTYVESTGIDLSSSNYKDMTLGIRGSVPFEVESVYIGNPDVTNLEVPGVAVVESGSNANGSYTKWADGTLRVAAIVLCEQLTSGLLYVDWSVPHSFYSDAYGDITVSGMPIEGPDTNIETYHNLYVQTIKPTKTSISIRVRTGDRDWSSGDKVNVLSTAWGRWKS